MRLSLHIAHIVDWGVTVQWRILYLHVMSYSMYVEDQNHNVTHCSSPEG